MNKGTGAIILNKKSRLTKAFGNTEIPAEENNFKCKTSFLTA